MAKVLYILVRTDMDSLGRGKGMAQASHISNQFTWDTIIAPSLAPVGEDLPVPTINPEALDWCREANGFGTAIVLAAPNLQQMLDSIEIARRCGFVASPVVDPEYHIADGNAHHIIPNVVVGGYVFADRAELLGILAQYKLMPNDPVA